MSRKKIKPDYDMERIQNEMIKICRELCVCDGQEVNDDDSVTGKKWKMTLCAAANELGISTSKLMKLLITGGYYTSDICVKVNELYNEGKTVPEIQEMLSVSRATVQSYLPYKKGLYKAKDTSVNADRIRTYRRRERLVDALLEDATEQNLWDGREDADFGWGTE